MSAKKIVQQLKSAVILLLVLSLFFISLPLARVQAASLPSGGSTIDAAAAISAGTYSVGVLEEKVDHFFSIGIKAGQELNVTGKFTVMAVNEQYGTMDTIELYDDNKESLTSAFDDAQNLITVAALASSEKSTHTFYIRISDDTWGTESGELTATINDRFDAGSGTDAGQAIASALSIVPGSYKGYYSEVDTDDFYTVSAKAGPFSVKLTSAEKTRPTVKILDINRTELKNEIADNEGQIMTVSTNIASDQTVYVDINCDNIAGCVSAASEYSMVIGATAATGGGGQEYPDVVPVVPTGGGVAIDEVVAPVLKKVYDDKAKVVSQDGKNTLIYILGRSVQTTDLAAIKAAMEGIGYKTKKFSSDQLIMTKGFKQLIFSTTPGTNKIEVKSSFAMNWLWAGIIVGAIAFILLILIIILATRKKKPVSKPVEASPAVAAKDFEAQGAGTPPTPPTAPVQ